MANHQCDNKVKPLDFDNESENNDSVTETLSISSHTSSSSLKYRLSVNSYSDDGTTGIPYRDKPATNVRLWAKHFEEIANEQTIGPKCTHPNRPNWWLNTRDSGVDEPPEFDPNYIETVNYLNKGKGQVRAASEPDCTDCRTIVQLKSIAVPKPIVLPEILNNRTESITDNGIDSGQCNTNTNINSQIPIIRFNSRESNGSINDDQNTNEQVDTDDDSYDTFSSGSDTEENDEDEHDNYRQFLRPAPDVRPSSTQSNKIQNIVQELIDNENTYINSLNIGISGYMTIYYETQLPHTMLGQKYKIFGNIERIKKFHEDEFRPALEECGEDVEKIAETFCKFIQAQKFYIYILYAMNRQKSEKLCEINKTTFFNRQNLIGDKLGVNSFLVQPIQRLPKYQLLIREMIKELGKHLDEPDVKQKIASCCRAEKSVQRLLDRLNESMSINDIIDCNDIQILHQGKFQKHNDFEIWDSTARRKYIGRVFLFDKSVVYTEILDKHRLMYRGHYPCLTTGFTFQGEKKFILYVMKRGQQEVEFTAEPGIVNGWISILTKMLTETEKRRKEQDRASRRISRYELSPVIVVRSPSMTSSRSTLSLNSNQWTISSGSDYDNRFSTVSSDSGVQTTWIDSKQTDQLMNAEKYYIQGLQEHIIKNRPTESDPDVERNAILFYTAAERISDFHRNILFPEMKECGTDSVAIFKSFKKYFVKKKFDDYLVYAAYAHYPDRTVIDEKLDRMALQLPIYQTGKYLTYFNKTLEGYLEEHPRLSGKTEVVILSEILDVIKKLENLLDLTAANFLLNELQFLVPVHGLAEYTDQVQIDGFDYRIILLEKALICVKTRQNVEQKEEYLRILFIIPSNRVECKEYFDYPYRLRIISKDVKYVKYNLFFMTPMKKSQFVKKMRSKH